MAQHCDDPTLGDLHADFDLRLVAGFVGPRGYERGAVVRRHLLVGGVDVGFVAMSGGDAGLEVVAHHDVGDPAVEVEGVRVRAHPMDELLAAQRFSVEVGGGPQDRHEEFGLEVEFQGRCVEDGNSEAGQVDEHLLTGLVVLAHHDALVSPPDPVALTELGAAVTIGVLFAVFKLQELERHSLSGELFLHRGEVGLGVARRRLRDVREESTLEFIVVHFLG